MKKLDLPTMPPWLLATCAVVFEIGQLHAHHWLSAVLGGLLFVTLLLTDHILEEYRHVLDGWQQTLDLLAEVLGQEVQDEGKR